MSYKCYVIFLNLDRRGHARPQAAEAARQRMVVSFDLLCSFLTHSIYFAGNSALNDIGVCEDSLPAETSVLGKCCSFFISFMHLLIVSD